MTTTPDLSRGDLRQILSLALDAGNASSRQEFAEVSVTGGEKLIPSDVVSYNEIDDSMSTQVVAAYPPDWTTWDLSTFFQWAHQNPLIDHYSKTGDGRALKISDFLPRDEFHALELYQEFYRPLGIEYQIAITLPAPKPSVIGIAFNRGTRDFTERERARLNVLRPHLAAAHHRLVEREELEARVAALERGAAEPVDALMHGLTPRELEVLASIADGLTAAAVGNVLGISPRTVERHLTHIYEKVGVRTQAGAVAQVFGR